VERQPTSKKFIFVSHLGNRRRWSGKSDYGEGVGDVGERQTTIGAVYKLDSFERKIENQYSGDMKLGFDLNAYPNKADIIHLF
jgi:hypothetical protein